MSQPTAKCADPVCTSGSVENLSLCGGCKQARYCSRECQVRAWKYHKTYCKHIATQGASSSSLSANAYYEKVAPHDPATQELASLVALDLPGPDGASHGFAFPVRRLVKTGKDTPENLVLLFGQNGQAEIAESYKQARMDVLLNPPPGSPAYVRNASLKLDETCPFSAPREPSPAEHQEVQDIKNMQGTIRRHMGTRGVENVNTNDMKQILVAVAGDKWPDAMQTYTTALNTMDRGVPLR